MAGIWAAAAAAIIMGGAGAVDTITDGAITVTTRTSAGAAHCPGAG